MNNENCSRVHKATMRSLCSLTVEALLGLVHHLRAAAADNNMLSSVSLCDQNAANINKLPMGGFISAANGTYRRRIPQCSSALFHFLLNI